MMSDTLADRLAAFALGTRFEDLPEAVVVEARRRLVDALGLRRRGARGAGARRSRGGSPGESRVRRRSR